MQATELLFQTIFDQLAEPRIVVQPDAPDFTIVTTNKAYKEATGEDGSALHGKSLWQLFRVDTASANIRAVFENGLNDAIRHRTDIKLPIFRFDIAATSTEKTQPRWWQVEISPVTDADNEVTYLVCATRNVTLHVQDQAAIVKGEHEQAALLVRQREQTIEAERSNRRNRELSDTEYRLNRIIAATPIGLSIIKGRDFIIETANDPILSIWGRRMEDVLGHQLLNVFPELKDQPFIHYLNQVFDTGTTVTLDRQPAVVVNPDGAVRHIFVDFSYDPLFDLNDQVDAVLVTVNDVTTTVRTQQQLKEHEEELEVINEELKATNEELYASNEELAAINEQLRKLKEQ